MTILLSVNNYHNYRGCAVGIVGPRVPNAMQEALSYGVPLLGGNLPTDPAVAMEPTGCCPLDAVAKMAHRPRRRGEPSADTDALENRRHSGAGRYNWNRTAE